jgi:hypothetical protein
MNLLREAVVFNDGVFPLQLAISGVMFWKGERITMAEFKSCCKEMGIRYSLA